MKKEYSMFQQLKNIELKIELQKIRLKEIWEELKVIYGRDSQYYEEYLNSAANEIFDISSFKLLLEINEDYEWIWSEFDIVNEFDICDWFLPTLEFFYNIFYTTELIAFYHLNVNHSFSGKEEFEEKFKIFGVFVDELKKFFDWIGYSLVEYDNQINKDSDYKEYHLVKKDTVKVIENINVADDLKTLLLELSQESLERKDLENYLNILYINYLENEQDQIKQYLGNKLHSNIFNLFNNGLIKHKDSENLNKISQFTEQEKLNALKWLKDIVLVYFAVSRNGNDYPEKIINSKHQNNAN